MGVTCFFPCEMLAVPGFPLVGTLPFSYVAKILRTKCSAPFPSHQASWVWGMVSGRFGKPVALTVMIDDYLSSYHVIIIIIIIITCIFIHSSCRDCIPNPQKKMCFKRIDAIWTVPNMAAGFLLEEISFLTYSNKKKHEVF